jgi:sulfatase modifying factor 1
VDDFLRIYDWPGFCHNGTCEYPFHDEWCPDGCSGSQCNFSAEQMLEWTIMYDGSFTMGAPTGQGGNAERPEHMVTMRAFEITRTEVTVWQSQECFDDGACVSPAPENCGGQDNWNMSDRADHPMNCVDWYMASDFCQWAGARLPSEAEWEYAATSEGQEVIYPWGDSTADCTYAIMDDGGGIGCGTQETWSVCSMSSGSSIFGLCDMAGNVQEWVMDDWHDSYDIDNDTVVDAPTDGSAWFDTNTEEKVVRGGSLESNSNDVRATSRERRHMHTLELATGFRCARNAVVLQGEVKTSVDPSSIGDGYGTLCIAVTDMCPSDTSPDMMEEYAHMEIYGADLSSAAALVPFSISVPEDKIASGTGFAVVAMLAEDGGSCKEGHPAAGDMITYDFGETGSLGCATFGPNGPFTALSVELNYIIPDDVTME